MYDIEEIKSRLSIPDAARALGIELKKQRGSIRSPFRQDKNPSFSIYEVGGAWRFHDFGTGDKGDVIDFIQLATGVEIAEALKLAAEMSGVRDEKSDWPKVKPKRVEIEQPLRDTRPYPAFNEMPPKEMADRTFRDWCERKGWADDLSTIERILKLGMMEANHGTIWFRFKRGLKIRRDSYDSHSSCWSWGKAQDCLYLEPENWSEMAGDIKTVILTEGETDAITAEIDCFNMGIDVNTLVLGVPGAHVIPHKALMTQFVEGRNVLIIGDNDEAGRTFTKNMEQLAESCGSGFVTDFEWNGVFDRLEDWSSVSSDDRQNILHELIQALQS